MIAAFPEGPQVPEIYLDYNASTPIDPRVVAVMRPLLDGPFANPSATHSGGRTARALLDRARAQVADLLGCGPDEIVFTSGGSEADNLALTGVYFALKGRGDHIITTAVEHPAILEPLRFLERFGARLTIIPVDRTGMIDPEDVRRAITPRTILVSVMQANNEVGTIEPIAEISKVCREAGVYLHTDAVQTVGNIPVDVEELGVDILSMSGHKLYGPKGVGAIYIRKGTKISRFIHGGEQERGMRAGTENIGGIAGLGAAAELASLEMDAKVPRITALRDRLIEGLQGSIDDLFLNGHPERRLPNNVHIGVRFIEGEAICLQLDTVGICASTGSACSSEALEPSHVLLAIGVPTLEAHGSVRFSLGRGTTSEEIDYVIENLPPIVKRLRAMSPLSK